MKSLDKQKGIIYIVFIFFQASHLYLFPDFSSMAVNDGIKQATFCIIIDKTEYLLIRKQISAISILHTALQNMKSATRA